MSEESATELEEETETEGQTEELEQDGGSAEEKPEGEEVEVFLAGEDSGSQPLMDAEQVSAIVSRRVNRARAKYTVRDDEANKLQASNDALREQNALYKDIVDQRQATEAPKRPIASDYLEGEDDSRFRTDDEAYRRQIIRDEIQKSQVPQTDTVTNQDFAAQQELRNRQTKHYERTVKLGVKDYEAMEDVAVETLGRDAVNQIINMTDKSDLIVYFLGKHPSEAQHFADLINTDARKALVHLGKLEEKVKARPKVSSTRVPDPDEERAGGASPSNKQRGPSGVTYE